MIILVEGIIANYFTKQYMDHVSEDPVTWYFQWKQRPNAWNAELKNRFPILQTDTNIVPQILVYLLSTEILKNITYITDHI